MVEELAKKYVEFVKGGNDEEAHKLLSGSCFRGQKRYELCDTDVKRQIERKVEAWEKSLKEERTYEFEKIDEKGSNDTKQKVFFKMTKGGASSSKPWTFVKEDDGNWYIDNVLA